MKTKSFILSAALLTLAGCSTTSSLLEGQKIDYKSAGKVPPLEIPPDLTSPRASDRFSVPDQKRGSTIKSEYDQKLSSRPSVESVSVLPLVDKTRIERAGDKRWLVVQMPADQVWPMVKDFWLENGFILTTESMESGVMETDWAENRAKIPQDWLRNVLGKVIDGMYSTAERDRFRTRLERGTEPNTTEIFISHRGLAEVYESGQSTRTIWQPRPVDPELEAEFLGRLVSKFGVDQNRAKSLLAAPATTVDRARLNKSDGTNVLIVDDPFDRAWRRVGLSLDRVGFTVEDRDRTKGLYFVRYADPDADTGKKKNEGFLSKLAFWRSDDPTKLAEQFRIQLKDSGNTTQIQVFNKDNQPERSETGNRILSLLLDQLK